MDAKIENLEVEAARKKAETELMTNQLRDMELALETINEQLQEIKTANKEETAKNRRIESMINDFLAFLGNGDGGVP